MTNGTICKPDCPNRSATCHAECEIYLAAWAENKRRYQANAERRKVQELTSKSAGESIRKRGNKIPQF